MTDHKNLLAAAMMECGLATGHGDTFEDLLGEMKGGVERLMALLDPPVCRLQFPDGSVPGNAKEAAEGWKKWADEFERRWKGTQEELRDHRYSGGADWAQMAADVDYGRGQ